MATPVRSNPEGYGIHSPFAFNLVTKVIFPEKKKRVLRDFFFSPEDQTGRVEDLLWRLLDYFKPGRIILVYINDESQISFPVIIHDQYNPVDPDQRDEDRISGNPVFIRRLQSEALMRKISDYNRGQRMIWFDDINVPVQLTDKDFLIIPGQRMPGIRYEDTAAESVCFFADLRSSGSMKNFRKLAADCNVSQTYEFNSCGIAIFNPKFQKENFVIKGKNSY